MAEPERAGPGPEVPAPTGVEIAPHVYVPEGVLAFSYSRSGGPGGQNVNKVSSKAELRLALHQIPISARARARLARLAGRRLTDEGELILTCEEDRSQSRNRAACFDKLRELIVQALMEPKVRRKTKPSKGSVQRRLDEKKTRARTKRGRGRHEAE